MDKDNSPEEKSKFKRCSKCHLMLPLDCFHKSSVAKDGHRSICKECRQVPKRKKKLELFHLGLQECNTCHQVKTLSCFHKQATGLTGHHSACKECRNNHIPFCRNNENDILIQQEKYRCIECNVIKPLHLFNKNKRNKSGRETRCKQCLSPCGYSRGELMREKSELLHQQLRRCPECREVKPIQEYYINQKGTPVGYCRRCNRIRSMGLEYVLSIEKEEELLQQGLKTCTRCEQVLPVNEYTFVKGKPIARCKQCTKDAKKKMYHRDVILSRKKQRGRYWQNRERILQQCKEYHNSPNGYLTSRKAKAKRRANKHSAYHEDYSAELKAVMSQETFVCFYCGGTFDTKVLHVEHYIPLSRGGADCISNLRWSCPACNLSKGSKTYEEWMEMKAVDES